MPVDLTNNDISTRYALQEDFDNGFVGRDRQVVIQTDDPKGYRPIIMDGATQGGKNKVALMDDVEDIYNRYNNYGILPEDATQNTYATVQQLQSTTANLSDYAGAQGQLVYNTETKHLHVMDGSTAGGIQVANYSDLLLADVVKETVLNTFFPVGSIYMDATGNINPNSQFGGTWEKIENRFLLASGTRGVGNTGGAETVTLNSNQIPSHNHAAGAFNVSGQFSFETYHSNQGVNTNLTYGAFYRTSDGSGRLGVTNYGQENGRANIAFNSNRSQGGNTANSGGGQAHENMPPYVVVNVWKRTA